MLFVIYHTDAAVLPDKRDKGVESSTVTYVKVSKDDKYDSEDEILKAPLGEP